MKNIMRLGIVAWLLLLAMTSCDPQDNNDYSLGTMPSADNMAFTATPGQKANVITLKNTSALSGVAVWDFGNGGSAQGNEVSVGYPFKGDYTVTMTLYATGGSYTIEQTVKIANDDLSLLETEGYKMLTGGPSDLDGKTWVFSQYEGGHFGIYPEDKSWDPWYAGPNEKAGSSLYTQEFTFYQAGIKMVWKNNGSVYTNAAGVTALSAMGHTESTPAAGDFDVKFTPQPAYTFVYDEISKTLTLSDGAFLGHYAGTSTYVVDKLEENKITLHCASKLKAGDNWVYVLVPKEKNVRPELPLLALDLAENFESSKLAVNFAGFGSTWGNPSPSAPNTSKNTWLYNKPKDKDNTGVAFTASGYKFDLTKLNKISLKVYFSSDNDYSTLAKTVSVILRNTEAEGADLVDTQVKMDKTISDTGKWIQCDFDFSSVKTRKDLNQIIIQMGGDNKVEGLFFFDDFVFSDEFPATE